MIVEVLFCFFKLQCVCVLFEISCVSRLALRPFVALTIVTRGSGIWREHRIKHSWFISLAPPALFPCVEVIFLPNIHFPSVGTGIPGFHVYGRCGINSYHLQNDRVLKTMQWPHTYSSCITASDCILRAVKLPGFTQGGLGLLKWEDYETEQVLLK